MTEDDDAALVRAAALGDAAAFAAIVRRHRTAVRWTCVRTLARGDDVEDAMQETFFKAYARLPGMTCDNLRGWLVTIARNVCIDRIRHEARHPRHVDLDELDPALEAVPGPDETMATGEGLIDHALGRLPDHHRVVASLRFVEELSHREIAEVMGKSPAQVKALIHRARLRLRTEYARAAV